MSAQREKLNEWVTKKIEQSIVKLLDNALPKIKEAAKDPYMWGWVQDIVDDLIDEIWPEVQQEIIFQLRMKTQRPFVEAPPENKPCCCLFYPWFWLRNWYLYTIWPCKNPPSPCS